MACESTGSAGPPVLAGPSRSPKGRATPMPTPTSGRHVDGGALCAEAAPARQIPAPRASAARTTRTHRTRRTLPDRLRAVAHGHHRGLHQRDHRLAAVALGADLAAADGEG